MRKLLLTIISLSIIHTIQAQSPPKRELRGVWISTHLSLDWPSRTQTPAQQRSALINILNHNKATGMNAVYLQVRSQSDAMYPSDLEPWSYYLTNQQGAAPSPLWDPLQFGIEESHKRGFEFHAWINPYRAVANIASANNPALYAESHVSKTHPEWMLTVGAVQILNPGLPEVRTHVTNVIVDILKRYDVDGIHFDDYFYPNGTTGDDAAYNADPRGFPATSAGRADWRRDNVNLLIKRINDSINAIKPWVKFGVSPSGIYRSSTDPEIGSPTTPNALQHYSNLFADTKKWIQSGWVDYLAPQVYWYIGQSGSDYKLLVPWWDTKAYGRHIYIGMADYKVNTTGWKSRSEIPNQIRINRSNDHVYGQIHFRHTFLAGNALNYRDSLRLRLYNKPALLPIMSWKDNVAPAPATDLTLTKNSATSITLSWTKPAETANEFDKAKRFVIYRSTNQNIDLEDANNILAITNMDENSRTDNTLLADSIYYYTVTSLDRLHNESAITNMVSNDYIKPTVVTQNITRTLVNGSVSVAATEIDNGSSDNWGIASMTLSKTTFTCSDIGENPVMLIVTDKAGNIDSASATITIEGTIPQPVISVTRNDNTFTGLSDNTIALGYGAQSLIINASNTIDGTTSYSWSPVADLSSSTTASTTFTPSAAGNYTFSVLATNEYGCTATASVTITVIDARCDNNKVVV
ncbi:MAG TPA: family 10 glycosylhydrolase, partial [Sphingobacteriaceae bacterium]